MAAALAASFLAGVAEGGRRSSLWYAAAAAQDADSFTPMPLDSGFGPIDRSAPAIPVDQIVARLAARETAFQQALERYTYRRAAKVDTLSDENQVTGEWYEVDDVVFDPSGRRMERVVDAPPSTLDEGGISMSPSDLHDIEYGYPFVLTTADLPKYDVAYVGRQKVDELECYVFNVGPKKIEKHERYLKGRIWVDATDLQIVVTDGRMVPDETKKGQQDLHPPFMTWRQQIDGHYWFPVYTKGEGYLHFAGGYGHMPQDVHVRDVVKYSDYKRFGSTAKIFYGGQEIPALGLPQSQPQSTPPKQ